MGVQEARTDGRRPKGVQTRLGQLLAGIRRGSGRKDTIYYLLMPYLPPRAQHTLYELDWGVAVDFWFCLVFFGLIKTIVNWRASRGVED